MVRWKFSRDAPLTCADVSRPQLVALKHASLARLYARMVFVHYLSFPFIIYFARSYYRAPGVGRKSCDEPSDRATNIEWLVDGPVLSPSGRRPKLAAPCHCNISEVTATKRRAASCPLLWMNEWMNIFNGQKPQDKKGHKTTYTCPQQTFSSSI